MLGASSAVEDVRRALAACSAQSAAQPLDIRSDSDGPLLAELLQKTLLLLRFGLLPGSSFLRFFHAAAKIIPRAPEIHDIIFKVMDANDAAIASMPIVDRERVYLIYSLQCPGSLMRTSQRCFRVHDVMREYYYQEAPFFDAVFLAKELQPVLMALARLKILSPSIEDGLRCLQRWEALHVDGASAVLVTPVNTSGGTTAVGFAPVVFSSSPSMKTAEAPAAVAGDSSETLRATECADSQPTPTFAAFAPVLVKKKRKTKLFADSATQVQPEERSDASHCIIKTKSVGVLALPNMQHAGVQTNSDALECQDLQDQTTSQQLRQWEASLLHRERQLQASLCEVSHRERAVKQRELLLAQMYSGAASPQSSITAYTTQEGTSASPRRTGRSVSLALQAAVDASQASVPRAESVSHSPKPKHPAASKKPASELPNTAASPEPAQPSPQKPRDAKTPSDVISTEIDWSDHMSLLTTDAVVEAQGSCCASCCIPLRKEHHSKQQLLHDATEQRAHDVSPPSKLAASVVDKAKSLHVQLKQTLLARVSPASRRGDSEPRDPESFTPASSNGKHAEPVSAPADRSHTEDIFSDVVDSSAGYRRCHYSGAVYCDRCMRDGSLFVVPYRVLHCGDAALYPVSNEAFQTLKRVYDQLSVTPSMMPAELLDAPSVQVARGLRSQLRILSAVVNSCKALPSALAQQIQASPYVLPHEPYTLRNLVVLLHRPSCAPGSQPAKDLFSNPFLDKLRVLRDALVLHCVKDCEACKTASTTACCLCSDRRALYLFDVQQVATCDRCSAVYHKTCQQTAEVCVKCHASMVAPANRTSF